MEGYCQGTYVNILGEEVVDPVENDVEGTISPRAGVER